MLYEYPDEFIVEVMYMDILEEENEKIDLQTNNSYNSLFYNNIKKDELIKKELLFRNTENIISKKYNKNTKHKKDEFILEKYRDENDSNIFKEFIYDGLITKEDMKIYLIEMSFLEELDNDYVVSEIEEK